MCRSANTVSIHLHNMEWKEGLMVIDFAHMKYNQCGERKCDPRNIYANPVDHIVCHLTTLRMDLNTFGLTCTKSTALFTELVNTIGLPRYCKVFFVRHREIIEK